MTCYGQMRQKLLDLLSSHVTWMPFAVKENETFDPAHVGLFSASAIVPDTHGLTDLLQKPGCFGLAGDAMARDHRKLLSETMPSA
jgi:hypothetical protein